jgi:cytochrome P450
MQSLTCQLPVKDVGLILGLGGALGLTLHHGFFKHGEWHIYTPQLLFSHLAVLAVVIIGPFCCNSTQWGKLMVPASIASAGYLVALLTSITVYRVWFHQLARSGFEGPLYLRTSKLWHAWICRKSLNHLFLDGLNKKYGDFVRTGPSEITVFHPDFFNATDGPKTECFKGEWYDLLFPESSLLTTRNRELHDARRKDWKVGFSPQALAHHFDKILTHLDALTDAIDGSLLEGKPVRMRDMFYWLGFDVMSDFVFSKSFGMLNTQTWHHMVIRLQRALSLLGPASPAPWLIHIAFRVAPRVYQIGDWFGMAEWTHEQIRDRLEAGSEKEHKPDLVHYLLEQKGGVQTPETILKIRGDSLNAIVAGSEPVPVVLIGLFAELAQKPEHIEGVYQELKDADINESKVLAKLPYLNAVIQEALRMYPVLPTGGSRKTGERGVTIGGVFIPPNTTMVGPRFTIQRREDCFERATEFIPERWTTRPEMVRNIAAYNPWGTAHHSCIARAMATDMLRATTARLIKRYRFRLAPGETGRRVLQDMKDQLAPNPGHLDLCFEAR